MSVDAYKLEIHKRDQMSKGELKRLRKEGKIPGVYYSQDSEKSSTFFIERSEIHNIQKSGARLLKISVGGGLKTVFFKSVQYHPVTDEILHIDLYGVKMDEKIQISVPIHLTGTPIGVGDEGGKLMQPLQNVEIECLPGDIPEFIEVDVSELDLNESIHVNDVALPENVEMVTSPEAVIALVTHAVEEIEPEVAEEEEDLTFEESDEDSDESEEDPQ